MCRCTSAAWVVLCLHRRSSSGHDTLSLILARIITLDLCTATNCNPFLSRNMCVFPLSCDRPTCVDKATRVPEVYSSNTAYRWKIGLRRTGTPLVAASPMHVPISPLGQVSLDWCDRCQRSEADSIPLPFQLSLISRFPSSSSAGSPGLLAANLPARRSLLNNIG